MKKILCMLLAAVSVFSLFACGGARDEIVVAQREAGSGTRDAFESIFNVKNKVTGKLIYNTTGSLKTSVASEKYGIGYISLGSIDATVKAVNVDGVVASEANILNDSYKPARPFNIITKKGATNSAATADFIKFIYSKDGQAMVKNAKLIEAQTADGATGVDYDTAANSVDTATIKISGSTSMEDVIKALTEKYNQKQSNVTFQMSFEGSSAGKTDVNKDDASRADIGLVSSALSSSDLEKFDGYKIATDGIAVIVHKNNAVTNLTTEQIVKIFTGEIKNWTEIA